MCLIKVTISHWSNNTFNPKANNLPTDIYNMPEYKT